MRRFSRQRGFTLIELMIVVAIVGVLAALAIYGVRKYLLNSKTTEAKNAVGQMAKDAKTAYERESMAVAVLSPGSSTTVVNNLCKTGTVPSVPSVVTSVAGMKYQSRPDEWTVDGTNPGVGFTCLKYSMSDPQYYMYTYVGTSGATGTFTSTANGDLDGNSTTSTFSINGSVVAGIVFVSPNFYENNAEE